MYVALVTSWFTIGDAPTFIVIVSVVTALIASVAPDAGSVDLGYVLVDVLPSIVQVNDSALSAMESVFDVVNRCEAEVMIISPVAALYVAPVTAFGKLPAFDVTPFVTADTNECV